MGPIGEPRCPSATLMPEELNVFLGYFDAKELNVFLRLELKRVVVGVIVIRYFLDQAFHPGKVVGLVVRGSTHEIPLLRFECIRG